VRAGYAAHLIAASNSSATACDPNALAYTNTASGFIQSRLANRQTILHDGRKFALMRQDLMVLLTGAMSLISGLVVPR